MAKATIARANYIQNNKLNNKIFHYSDNSPIPKDTALSLYWNYGRLTDKANGNPNTDSK